MVVTLGAITPVARPSRLRRRLPFFCDVPALSISRNSTVKCHRPSVSALAPLHIAPASRPSKCFVAGEQLALEIGAENRSPARIPERSHAKVGPCISTTQQSNLPSGCYRCSSLRGYSPRRSCCPSRPSSHQLNFLYRPRSVASRWLSSICRQTTFHACLQPQPVAHY